MVVGDYLSIVIVVIIAKMGLYNSIRELYYEYKKTSARKRSKLFYLSIIDYLTNEFGTFLIPDKWGSKIEYASLNHRVGHRWFMNIFWLLWILVDIRDNFNFISGLF